MNSKFVFVCCAVLCLAAVALAAQTGDVDVQTGDVDVSHRALKWFYKKGSYPKVFLWGHKKEEDDEEKKKFIIKYKLDKWEDDDNNDDDCKKMYKRKCFYKHNDDECDCDKVDKKHYYTKYYVKYEKKDKCH